MVAGGYGVVKVGYKWLRMVTGSYGVVTGGYFLVTGGYG